MKTGQNCYEYGYNCFLFLCEGTKIDVILFKEGNKTADGDFSCTNLSD